MSNSEDIQNVIVGPLQAARDHAHWQAVCGRNENAAHLERVIDAALGMARALKGEEYRKEAAEWRLANPPPPCLDCGDPECDRLDAHKLVKD